MFPHEEASMSRHHNMNVWAVGFFVYANLGGLTIPNVTMVTVFLIAFVLCYVPVLVHVAGDCFGPKFLSVWILPAWAVVALMFTMLHDKLGNGGGGTVGESQPLVS